MSLVIDAVRDFGAGLMSVRAAAAPYEEYKSPPNPNPKKPFNRAAESVKVRSALVSSFHATVAVMCVIVYHIVYNFEPLNWERNMQGGIATLNNENGDYWLARVASFTAGYFIYDTFCMIYYHRYIGDVMSYIHHIVIGVCFLCGIYTGIGSTYHFIFLFSEMSTPPLNFKNLYRHSPKAYRFWSMAFVVAFYFSRGIYGLGLSVPTYYCLYTFWQEKRVVHNSFYFEFLVFQQFFGFTVSRILDCYWMILIAKYIKKDQKAAKQQIAPKKEE